jgi:hypothetical protein
VAERGAVTRALLEIARDVEDDRALAEQVCQEPEPGSAPPPRPADDNAARISLQPDLVTGLLPGPPRLPRPALQPLALPAPLPHPDQPTRTTPPLLQPHLPHRRTPEAAHVIKTPRGGDFYLGHQRGPQLGRYTG